MTRRIRAHKGGRTASAPRARIRPQTLAAIRATMREREASFADLLEETYSGGKEMSATLEITKKDGTKWEEECKNNDDAEGYAVIIWHSHHDLERIVLKGNPDKVLYES